MSLMKCNSCGNDIAIDAKICPRCGHNMKNDNGGKSKVPSWFVVIVIIGIIGLMGTLFNKTNHDDGKCDICGKTATYSSSKEEYCTKHLKNAVEWYIKQGE